MYLSTCVVHMCVCVMHACTRVYFQSNAVLPQDAKFKQIMKWDAVELEAGGNAYTKLAEASSYVARLAIVALLAAEPLKC